MSKPTFVECGATVDDQHLEDHGGTRRWFIPEVKIQVVGRPLPKGTSPGIIGIVVSKRRKPIVFPF